MAFIEGFGVGLAMIVFIGPVFFTLLKSSLQYGFGGGMMVALGIVISDLICVTLCFFGAIPFFKNPVNQLGLAIAGSVILIGLGLRYLLRPVLYTMREIDIPSPRYSNLFAKGFIVNFVNPFVFLVWIGVIGLGRTKFGLTADLFIFLSASLLGVFANDSLKVIFSHRIKRWIRQDILLKAYRIIGIVLIGFGLRMLWFIM